MYGLGVSGTSPATNLGGALTGTLPVSNGGTGVTTSTGTTNVVLSGSPTIATPTLTGAVPSYNGLSTAGQGIPPIVAATNLSGQAFGVFNTATPVTLVATGGGNAGTYRVSVYFIITTTFVTNTTEVITVGWTDDQGARTAAVSLTLSAGQNGQLTQTIRSSGSAAITYTPSVTGTAATAGAAAFSVIVERLV